MKIALIKYLKRLGSLFFITLFCLVLLEISFRFQWIEFYQSELKGLNTTKQLASKKDNILVFGDSFSAHPESYVKYLRNNFPEFNFINSAIPGTGILQHELIFKKRINTYKPKMIIYQFYVGNDFLDIKHPINFKKNSFLRNVFWKASEHFLILKYLNYRLAFLHKTNHSIEKLHKPSFSEKLYNRRVKINYQADSDLLNHTILMHREIKPTYAKWKNKLLKIKQLTGDTIPINIIVIPHNSQLNNTYLKQNNILGASLTSNILNPSYPLLQQIMNDFKNDHVINPLPLLQRRKSPNLLYYQNDPHLTILGQKELGKIVASYFYLKHE